MASIRAAGLFLLGTSAGFGAALLVFVARVLDPGWAFPLNTVNAFLVGLWLVTVAVCGGVVVTRQGVSLRIRTLLAGIALLACLLGTSVIVWRRSREYWGLSVQHRLQAAATLARYRKDRLDPRVPREQAADLDKHADWQRRTGQVYSRAAYAPWLGVPALPACGCRACAGAAARAR